MSTNDFDRHFAPLLATFAPPSSEVHRITEVQRIAADIEYNRRKNSGELLRRDIDRDLQAQRDSGALE